MLSGSFLHSSRVEADHATVLGVRFARNSEQSVVRRVNTSPTHHYAPGSFRADKANPELNAVSVIELDTSDHQPRYYTLRTEYLVREALSEPPRSGHLNFNIRDERRP